MARRIRQDVTYGIAPQANQKVWTVYVLKPGGRHGVTLTVLARYPTKAEAERHADELASRQNPRRRFRRNTHLQRGRTGRRRRAAKRAERTVRRLVRRYGVRKVIGEAREQGAKRHRRNPMLAVVGANPSTRGARKIGYVREIRYIRGPGLRHAGQRFKHVFKTREACIYTLRDGSLLIRG